MRRNPILAIVALAAICFTACKNGGLTNGLPIPSDASMVVHMNTASLTSKLSWKEIQESGWYKKAFEKAQDSVYKAILQNPETSGVDLSSDFVVFSRKAGQLGYLVFEGKIRDAATFESFAKKIKDGQQPIKKDDLTTLALDEQAQLVWNKETFMVISNQPGMGASAFGMQNQGMPRTISPDSLTGFAKDLLALKSDASLEKDKRFKDLANAKGDVHMWVNSSSLSDMAGGMMSMMKLNNLLEGNISTYTVNFDKGKVDMTSKVYLNEALTKIMEKYPAKKLDAASFKRIPSNNVVGAMAWNINPEALKEILKLGGLDGMANGALGQFNITLDEILNATGGNFLFSISDFVLNKNSLTGQSGSGTKTDVSMKNLFALSVKDRASFDKLLSLFRNQMGGASKPGFSMLTNNEWFVASNDSAYAQAYLTGGSHEVNFADKLSGHDFGMYVDIQKAVEALGKSKFENAYDSTVYAINKDMWEDAIGTGGDFKDGAYTAQFTLNLRNKTDNALKQFNQYGDKMAAADKLRPKPQYDLPETQKDSLDAVEVSPGQE